MSKHVTYRGTTIDMDSLRRENEKSIAIGNMKVNAKGDQIGKEQTKTADQLARENHRIHSAVVSTGLKGKQPDATGMSIEKAPPAIQRQTKITPKKIEKELPSGDIIIGDSSEN